MTAFWALLTWLAVGTDLATHSPVSHSPVSLSSSGSPAPIQLEWTAPSSCPDEAAIQDSVRSLISADTRSALSQTLRARGTVSVDASGRWQLNLQTRVGDLEGERHLSAETCGRLSQVAALVLALIINPDAGRVPLTFALEAPPAPAIAPPVVEPAQISVGVEARSRGLPSREIGLGGRAAYLGSRFGFQASADWFPSRRETSATQPLSGGNFHWFQTFAWGCGLSRSGRRARGEACLGAGVNRMSSVGTGIANPREDTAWWPSVGAEIAARIRVAWRVEGRLFVATSLSFRRPRFAIDDVGLVYQPSLWNFSVGSGLSVHF